MQNKLIIPSVYSTTHSTPAPTAYGNTLTAVGIPKIRGKKHFKTGMKKIETAVDVPKKI